MEAGKPAAFISPLSSMCGCTGSSGIFLEEAKVTRPLPWVFCGFFPFAPGLYCRKRTIFWRYLLLALLLTYKPIFIN